MTASTTTHNDTAIDEHLGQSHTFCMTMTTIRVDTELRDELKALAKADDQTLGELLADLAGRERRRRMKLAAREAIRRNPPDDEYYEEFLDWQSGRWD
ncbi:hypothetical protein [Corynebacterium sp. SA-MJD20WY100]|uniref:hypothetical protein n=1 Tax=Corynebacterium sp. SA-MJD20WY100 TaxID=3142969 RepID=UPI00322180C7